MELKRRNLVVYGLLLGVWLFVVVWQIAEHNRVKELAREGVRNRAQDIADTIGAAIRGMQFRGAVFQSRLEDVLNELVNERTNRLVRSRELVWIAVLNPSGEALASAGNPTIELSGEVELPEGGLWTDNMMTMEFAVGGLPVGQEGTNQAPTVLPASPRETAAPPPDGFRGRGPHREPGPGDPPPDRRPGGDNRRDDRRNDARDSDGPRERPRRPFWARGMDDAEYQAMVQRRELHGLVLAISTANYMDPIRRHDIWLRYIIIFFSGVSALGLAVAWRTISRSSDLQMRLVRASELNMHLREMNLAAAGLAHETRNPLNIIRGQAHMISKSPDAAPDIREKSRGIVDETDKVTAQLNEFINYSRPREVRRSVLVLTAVVNEVVRALGYDIEEKKIRLEVKGDPVSIEADEQMLRQVLFNLVLNAIQALSENGEIQIVTQRLNAAEASLEIRDNGPGVPADRRAEIFKPYFTTQQKGTGLGLAIVQQIVLAHGWEIECLANQPAGAIFRITHLKLAKG